MPAFSRWVAALLLALLLSATAWAGFSDDYVAGLAALDHGQYAQAEQYLRKALGAQPNPVSRVMIDGVAQPYLPHHFLGMTLLRQGDCAAAGREWNEAMNLRMLGRLRSLRTQEDQLLAQCKPREVASKEKPATVSGTQTAVPSAAGAAVAEPKAAVAAAHSAQAGVPAALAGAFEGFVAGRYASAAKLDIDGFTNPRARFHAYLLRSAARFALARMGDQRQLEGARNDARAARALAKSSPDARVFSPAFRAFYAAAQ